MVGFLLPAVLGVLMAAGATQPAGNGGPILLEDHAHADASLDGITGSYSLDDAYLKNYLAADGVTPAIQRYGSAGWRHYLIHVGLQIGDGAGVAATTFKLANCSFEFDPGKTLSYATNGTASEQAGRRFEAGIERLDGSESYGTDGVIGIFGATTTLRGVVRLFDSELRAIGFSLIYFPGSAEAAALANLVDSTLRANLISFSPGTIAIPSSRRNAILGSPATGPIMTAFNVLDPMDTLVAVAGGSPQYFIRSGALVGRGFRLRGQVSQGQIQAFNNVAPAELTDTDWSTLKQESGGGAVLNPQNDRASFGCLVLDSLGAPLSGKRVRLKDKDGAFVAEAVTGSDGMITFGAGSTIESVIVRQIPALQTAYVERGPFTLEVNPADALEHDPAYPSALQILRWPRVSQGLATRFLPLRLVITLPDPQATSDRPYFQDADIALLVEDSGQEVSVGADVTKGYVHRVTRKLLLGEGDGILGLDVYVFVKTGSLPSLAVGIALGTDGELFRVRDVRKYGDGAMTLILCAVSS